MQVFAKLLQRAASPKATPLLSLSFAHLPSGDLAPVSRNPNAAAALVGSLEKLVVRCPEAARPGGAHGVLPTLARHNGADDVRLRFPCCERFHSCLLRERRVAFVGHLIIPKSEMLSCFST